MMTIETRKGKIDPHSPPLHVHVDQETPVHVHIKKPGAQKKSATARAVEERLRKTKLSSGRSFGAGNLRPTASARGPWVPAPAKSTRNKKFSWQSGTHSLSVEPPDSVHSTMRMEDLHRDYDDEDNGRFQQYERKIDRLMTQVGTLKSQRDLERTKREAEKTKDDLVLSRKVIENQEEELIEFRDELETTERENKHLRKSVDRLKDETDYGMLSRDHEHTEHDRLLKKMVEAELDAGAAVKQVTALRDVCHGLKEEKRMSSHDIKVITKQRDLLIRKLEDFENTNAGLRQMLRDQHRTETAKGHSEEQRDVLLKKLTESDATNQKLRVTIMDRDHELDSMKAMLDAERVQGKSMADLQASIETTRAHLQNQLRKREGDCNRMAVQIRKLENQIEQERIEVEHVQGLLHSAKEKAIADKDALKKATRAQKERATRSEDTVEKLNSQLLEVETLFAENQLAMDQLKSRHEKVIREKGQVEGDSVALSSHIEELETRYRDSEFKNKLALDEAKSKLHNKTAEANSVKLENEKLRATLATVQDKLTFGESEIDQLKSSLHEYENLVTDYKSQVNSSRREALDVSMRLEQQEQEKRRLQQDSNAALENIRSELDRSVHELDETRDQLTDSQLQLKDLPHVRSKLEMTIRELHVTEHKLQDTEQKLDDSTNVHGELQQRVHELEGACDRLGNIEHKLEDVTHVHNQLESCKKDLEKTTTMLHVSEQKEMESNHVRDRLELRLKELEPLPAMLHGTEKQLLETTEKLLAQERRSSEQANLIAEFTKKIDHQTGHMESFREKWHSVQDETRTLKAEQEALQRRLKETEDENRELHSAMVKREEIIHQNQLRLEEKTRENNSLARQLEQAIADTRRLEEEAQEKAIQRERNSQARILDLESQSSRCKTEVLQIKRQKEDAERKFNSQLYDLKDRLEQSHSTNRSMQNYVQFLKNSYSNVFGETSFTGSPYKSRHSPLH